MRVERAVDELVPEHRPEPAHAVRLGNLTEERRPLPRLVETCAYEEDGEKVVVRREHQVVRYEVGHGFMDANHKLLFRDARRGRGADELLRESSQDACFPRCVVC